jgi:hypothetical protein
MKKVMTALACILLSSCANTNVQTYSRVNAGEKTVTVPAGSKGLKGVLKAYLSKNGWKMSVYQGPTVTQGSRDPSDGSQVSKKYDTFNTRYTLQLSTSRAELLCMNESSEISYELSFVDNHTGMDVFTLDGKSCDSYDDVVEKFGAALR